MSMCNVWMCSFNSTMLCSMWLCVLQFVGLVLFWCFDCVVCGLLSTRLWLPPGMELSLYIIHLFVLKGHYSLRTYFIYEHSSYCDFKIVFLLLFLSKLQLLVIDFSHWVCWMYQANLVFLLGLFSIFSRLPVLQCIQCFFAVVHKFLKAMHMVMTKTGILCFKIRFYHQADAHVIGLGIGPVISFGVLTKAKEDGVNCHLKNIRIHTIFQNAREARSVLHTP